MTPTSQDPVRVLRLPLALRNLAELATVLERVELGRSAPDPAQYRLLVAHIESELRQCERHPALDQLLACFPATAQVYENQHYDVAGLCRNGLEQSVESERTARALLQRLAAGRSMPDHD